MALAHFKQQLDDLIGETTLRAFAQIFLKGFADVVSGEIFDGVQNLKLMLAGSPGFIWCERPAGFMVG